MKKTNFTARSLGKAHEQRKMIERMISNGKKVVVISKNNSPKTMNTNPANILKEQGFFDTDY